MSIIKNTFELVSYIPEKENMTPEEIENFANITPQSVRAFEEDLNDDGVNEIIGVVYSTYYFGAAGYDLFILEKELIGYKEISLVSFEPQAGVDILINKTNGYHDIMLAGSNSFAPKIRFVARIKDALYQWKYLCRIK